MPLTKAIHFAQHNTYNTGPFICGHDARNGSAPP